LPPTRLVFVSAFAPGEKAGIHAFEFDSNHGTLKPLHRTTDVQNPFFIAPYPGKRFLYAIDAEKVGGDEDEKVAAFILEGGTGRLKKKWPTWPSSSNCLHSVPAMRRAASSSGDAGSSLPLSRQGIVLAPHRRLGLGRPYAQRSVHRRHASSHRLPGPHRRPDLCFAALTLWAVLRTGSLASLGHSDRSSQYGSKAFRALLRLADVSQSMSARATPYHNAWTESFMGKLKAEMLQNGRFINTADARTEIFAFIDGHYNTQRLHSSLNYRPLTTSRPISPSPTKISFGLKIRGISLEKTGFFHCLGMRACDSRLRLLIYMTSNDYLPRIVDPGRVSLQ